MRSKKFNRLSYYLLLGAFFFTPISAYIVVPLLAISLIFFILSRRTLYVNFLDKTQFALLVAVILSSIFAVNKLHSFYAGTAFIAYLLAYFLAKGIIENDERIEGVVKILGILVLIVSIIGIIQYFTGFSLIFRDIPIVASVNSKGRIASICYNTLILASFLGFCIPVLVAFFMKGDNRIFFGFSIVLGLVAFILTYSRGPTIGLIGALFLFFLLLRKRTAAVVILFVSVIIILFATPLRVRFLNTFNCYNDFSRIIAFHAGINMWKDNSILTGVGIHNFYLLFEKYALPPHSKGPHYIHNMYLNFLVDAGIIGFLALMTVFVTTLEWIRKKFAILKDNCTKSWLLAGLFGSFFGLLIHNLFDNTIYVMGFGILFWMCMGIVSSIDRTLPSKNIKD